MKALSSMLIAMLMLGPIGMGMLFNVDSPAVEDVPLTVDVEKPIPEDHGTRSEPDEPLKYLNLYFHAVDDCMNTSTMNVFPYQYGTGTITFTLQDPLEEDFLVEGPAGIAMKAQIYIDTPTDIEISVYDNSVDGDLVGSGTLTEIKQQTRAYEEIDIPIAAQWGESYSFASGHQIVVQLVITGGGLHYDRPLAQSRLRLYCKPITDITVNTYNFNEDPKPKTRFYPNDIDFPMDRTKVIVKGAVTDVFGLVLDEYPRYIQGVEIQIEGPDTNFTDDASWDGRTSTYGYVWDYPVGQYSGEYTVTTHVFDRQNNSFTVSNTFIMSDYGVLLTSPFQDPEEGSYKADARRNVIEGNKTTYYINVWNIGNYTTGISLETSGPSGEPEWDWLLKGGNLTNPNQKTGNIDEILPGQYKGIELMVDAKDNPRGNEGTIVVTAKSSMDPSELVTLNTITLVVLKYDVELKFLPDFKKSQEKTVEMGSEVSYNFRVTNNGGTNDTINIEVGTLPSGWEKLLSQQSVFLDPRGYKDLTLTLTTSVSGGDMTVPIDITGESQGAIDNQLSVSDSITTITTVTTGLDLEFEGSQRSIETNPDETITYQFKLTNTGTSTAGFTVTFTGPSPSDGWKSGDVSLSQTHFALNPDIPQPFSLYVEPTMDVTPNENFSITVRASRDDAPSTRYDVETVYCEVTEVYEIELIQPHPSNPHLYGEAEPGEDVNYTIKIMNNGNIAEKVSINVYEPGGWKVHFDNASSTWLKDIEPQQIEEISFVLTVPEDAEGDETVDITMSVVPAVSDSIDIQIHTKVEFNPMRTLSMLIVPLLLFIVIIVMVVVIIKRR